MTSYYTIELHANQRRLAWLKEAEQRRLLRAAGAGPERRRAWRARLSFGAIRRLTRVGEAG